MILATSISKQHSWVLSRCSNQYVYLHYAWPPKSSASQWKLSISNSIQTLHWHQNLLYSFYDMQVTALKYND